MRRASSFFGFFLLFFCSALGWAGEVDGDFTRDEILFVSLGSICEPAHEVRFCGLRKAAFPFDWIVSMDGEALIEMLSNDFQGLFDDRCFVPFGPAGHLLQTRYHLEFLHEGDFNHRFNEQLCVLKDKYQRRIDRFRSLKTYEGKLVFLRYANPSSMTDQNRFYHFKENLEITEPYAQRLYRTLTSFFPRVDAYLIILNPGQGENFETQNQLGDRISIYRFPAIGDLQTKIDKWRGFFEAFAAERNCRLPTTPKSAPEAAHEARLKRHKDKACRELRF